MNEIHTPRLTLRPFAPGDLADLHAQIYSDPDVTRYLPGGKPRPLEQTQLVLSEFINHRQRHGFAPWAVIHKGDNRFIGFCGLIYVLDDEEDVEMIYAIGKDYWKQGLTTEAAFASLKHGFETTNLEAIIALAYPENTPSQRVMQKLGMKHEGLTDLYHGAELVLYSILREEFEAASGAT